MKAITRRGRKRDFVDLYKLLELFSLKDMLTFFSSKYPAMSEEMVVKSVVYFEDAEGDNDPKCFFKYDWKKIKQTITNEVKQL